MRKIVLVLLALMMVAACAFAQKNKKILNKLQAHSEMVEVGRDHSPDEIYSLSMVHKPYLSETDFLVRIAKSLNYSLLNLVDTENDSSYGKFRFTLNGVDYECKPFNSKSVKKVLKKLKYSPCYLGDDIKTEGVVRRDSFHKFSRSQYVGNRMEGHYDLTLADLDEFKGLDTNYKIPLILAYCGNVIWKNVLKPLDSVTTKITPKKDSIVSGSTTTIFVSTDTVKKGKKGSTDDIYNNKGDTASSATKNAFYVVGGILLLGGTYALGYELGWFSGKNDNNPVASPGKNPPPPPPPSPNDTTHNGGPGNIDPTHRMTGGSQTPPPPVPSPNLLVSPKNLGIQERNLSYNKSLLLIRKEKAKSISFVFQTKICIPIFRKTNLVEIMKGINFSCKPIF